MKRKHVETCFNTFLRAAVEFIQREKDAVCKYMVSYQDRLYSDASSSALSSGATGAKTRA